MTRVVNLEAIEIARNELIEKIKGALNLKEIKKILEDQHNLIISDDLKVDKGEMVIHDNKIAFRMEFEVLLSLFVLVDNEGNFIPPEETQDESIEGMGTQAEDIVREMEI